MKGKKKAIVFGLNGQIFNKTYGAKRIDADGIIDMMKSNNVDAIGRDNLDGLKAKDFDYILIIPKNAGMFDKKEGIEIIKKSHFDFINQIKQIEEKDRPKIVMFFFDIQIGIHGNYNNQEDIFDGLTFDCVYDFSSNEISKARDIYVDKKYQKHIKNELGANVTLSTHYPIIKKTAKEKSDLDLSNKDINEFYYGNYRAGVVDSLKKMHFGENKNDLMIGSSGKFGEIFNVKTINKTLPMKDIKEYIKKAKYNLLPYEENKTNKIITARILELAVFGDGFDNVISDGWSIVDKLKKRTKEQIIKYFDNLFNKSRKDIFEFTTL